MATQYRGIFVWNDGGRVGREGGEHTNLYACDWDDMVCRDAQKQDKRTASLVALSDQPANLSSSSC